jgi:hypothetical protein
MPEMQSEKHCHAQDLSSVHCCLGLTAGTSVPARNFLGAKQMDAKQMYLSKPWLRYYPEGVPAEIEIPRQSVPDLIDEVTEKYPRKDALVFYGKKITYKVSA